jgi:hypothetical protein
VTYLYLCPIHGELELEHRITADRAAQRCPELIKVKARGRGCDRTTTCGKPLKPLIALGAHSRDLPAVFKGRDWPRKQSMQYRDAGTIDLADGDYNEQKKAKRDKVAVR